jgi:hypothetical protein
MDRWRAEHALAREIRSRMGLCRKFSLEAICGMVSPSDSQYKEKESADGGELQGGPFPQGYYTYCIYRRNLRGGIHLRVR